MLKRYCYFFFFFLFFSSLAAVLVLLLSYCLYAPSTRVKVAQLLGLAPWDCARGFLPPNFSIPGPGPRARLGFVLSIALSFVVLPGPNVLATGPRWTRVPSLPSVSLDPLFLARAGFFFLSFASPDLDAR